MLESILKFIAAGGGGGVVAWAIFTFFGKSWIKNKFSKNLEEAKAEISLLSSRRMKLHDKEYEVFPEMWSRLVDANNSLSIAITSVHTTQDFTRMTDADLTEWAGNSGLSDHEKLYFLETTDKHKAYIRILDYRDIDEAEKKFQKFHEYLESNRIFLNPDIKDTFSEIDSLIAKSRVAKKVDLDLRGKTGGTDLIKKASDLFEKEVKPLMNEIELLVQKKLFPENEVKKAKD